MFLGQFQKAEEVDVFCRFCSSCGLEIQSNVTFVGGFSEYATREDDIV